MHCSSLVLIDADIFVAPANNSARLSQCLARDQELERRITEHQKARGPEWQTIEVPTALPEAVAFQGSKADVILVDCLTLWVSNFLAEGASQKKILAHSDALTKAIHKVPCSVILV
jgi:adenosylcobinamide kinase/adenosylcobinamide-phosphate guanylyltransferase